MDKKKKHDIEWFFACGHPWYKKWWLWFLVLLSILLVATPFIINCAYLAGRHLKEPNTSYTASDLLSLYGSLLSFLGTIILGVISIIQNSRATKISQQVFEEQRRAQLPILQVDSGSTTAYKIEDVSWNLGEKYGSDMCFDMQKNSHGGHQIGYISYSLKNISGFCISGIRVTKCTLNTIGKINFQHLVPVFSTSYCLGDNETKKICIKLISDEYNLSSLDKTKLQISSTFECLNAQKNYCEFKVVSIIHDMHCEVLGEEIISKYKVSGYDNSP